MAAIPLPPDGGVQARVAPQGDISLIFDQGMGQYFVRDARTQDEAPMINPPLGQRWEIRLDDNCCAVIFSDDEEFGCEDCRSPTHVSNPCFGRPLLLPNPGVLTQHGIIAIGVSMLGNCVVDRFGARCERRPSHCNIGLA